MDCLGVYGNHWQLYYLIEVFSVRNSAASICKLQARMICSVFFRGTLNSAREKDKKGTV